MLGFIFQHHGAFGPGKPWIGGQQSQGFCWVFPIKLIGSQRLNCSLKPNLMKHDENPWDVRVSYLQRKPCFVVLNSFFYISSTYMEHKPCGKTAHDTARSAMMPHLSREFPIFLGLPQVHGSKLTLKLL